MLRKDDGDFDITVGEPLAIKDVHMEKGRIEKGVLPDGLYLSKIGHRSHDNDCAIC